MSDSNRFPHTADVLLPSSSSQVELDLSETGIDTLPEHYLTQRPHLVRNLSLSRNNIIQLPSSIRAFSNLCSINVSSNSLANLPEELGSLHHLCQLDASNNLLEGLPKSMEQLTELQNLNLSGNRFTHVPQALFRLTALRALYMGGNLLEIVPNAIGTLLSLEVLYLGGNRLREVPATIGQLVNLSVLSLCANQLETIPPTIADLQSLRTLALHDNVLTTLPTGIVHLRNLQHLSLRNNPLVNKFVRDLSLDPPSLKELAARTVRMRVVPSTYLPVLPAVLSQYIATANQCVNPNCKGVYFDACVEHVKFVDFCGKYRVPLLQYICSPRCSSPNPAYAYSDASASDDDEQWPTSSDYRLRKVMLG